MDKALARRMAEAGTEWGWQRLRFDLRLLALYKYLIDIDIDIDTIDTLGAKTKAKRSSS